jgi:hypothetical protein
LTIWSRHHAGYILPNTKNQKILQAHTNGSLKTYFPYYSMTNHQADSVFCELTTIAPELHKDLLDFASFVANSAPIPNTLFNYKLLADVRDMVNEKRHDKLIAVVSAADAEYLIERPGLSILHPIRDQKGWSSPERASNA